GQDLYMQETPPFPYLEHLATSVQPLLQRMLQRALAALPTAAQPSAV
ncbi:hypothetical protein HA630_02055, partial [Aquabacterium sp. A08]|nr:hypothetical protein [Aquabacterium sp. A08]